MASTWIPHMGQFRHHCKYCGGEFLGRENKQYCAPTCKSRFNNELAAKDRLATIGSSKAILNNINVLETELGNEESVYRTMPELLSKGLSVSAPSQRICLPSGEQGSRFGSYLMIEIEKENTIMITKEDVP
jgi:hypothetical protein